MAGPVRSKVEFRSGGERCVGWFYPGSNRACIVMATGAGVTKEPGTDRFAARFQAAGYAVLAFDYRHIGESGGQPREIAPARRQVADLRAAISFAATLPGVRADRLVAWGFSLGGGHVMRVAQTVPLAAAIAQTPFADGMASTPAALRHETLGVLLSFPLLAASDALGGLIGRSPRLIPLAGPRGTTAMLTTPDSLDGERALDPNRRYPGWTRMVAVRSVLPLTMYRPSRGVQHVRCPMLFVVANQDQSVLAEPALRAAGRAPLSRVLQVDGGHYAPFLGAHEAVVTAELAFLDCHLAGRPDNLGLPSTPPEPC